MIPDSLRHELEQRVAHAVTNREAAVDVMKELQHHYGWLTDEAVLEAAEILGLTTLQVEELATFYEMIYRRPVGRHVIHVCDSISCWSMGGETLMDRFTSLLGIDAGGTTPDGTFTLLPCCCLGNCGNAPAVMVGERQFGPVLPDNVLEFLNNLQNTGFPT
jgi:NADH-quinone oxidoreductase subunit E